MCYKAIAAGKSEAPALGLHFLHCLSSFSVSFPAMTSTCSYFVWAWWYVDHHPKTARLYCLLLYVFLPNFSVISEKIHWALKWVGGCATIESVSYVKLEACICHKPWRCCNQPGVYISVSTQPRWTTEITHSSAKPGEGRRSMEKFLEWWMFWNDYQEWQRELLKPKVKKFLIQKLA